MGLVLGDCLEVFLALPEHHLDAVVDDPPAGIGFMGRSWDRDRGGRAKWVQWLAERKAAQLRACKPGAYSLTWALPRTSHWTATALEDAGWMVRDVVTHHFGQGWPKGESQLKPASEHWILAQKPFERGLSARANVERWGVGILGIDACRVTRGSRLLPRVLDKGVSNEWGRLHNRGEAEETTLGSWPTNLVLSHCPGCEERGTRTVASGITYEPESDRDRPGALYSGKRKYEGRTLGYAGGKGEEQVPAFDCVASCVCGASVLHPAGGGAPRCGACGQQMAWACPVAEMDAQSGFSQSPTKGNVIKNNGTVGYGGAKPVYMVNGHGDEGGASRFFPTFSYSAKASTAERDAGCEHLLWKVNKRHPFGFERVSLEEWKKLEAGIATKYGQDQRDGKPPKGERAQGNVHPTVKPLDLCEWLLDLVVPELDGYSELRRAGDGFCGSGSIPVQAWRMGMDFVACDVSSEALEIARARLHYWQGGLHVQARTERSSKSQRRAQTPAKRQREPVPEQSKIPGT